MSKYVGREFAKPSPDQFFFDFLPFRGAHGGQNHQRPATRPFRVRCAVDAPRRLGEPLAPVMRQTVFAEFAGAVSLEPTVLCEPCRRGSYQALIEPKRSRQGNEASQGDGTTARHDRIDENGHDERAASQGPLPAKASNEISSGGGGGDGHFWPL